MQAAGYSLHVIPAGACAKRVDPTHRAILGGVALDTGRYRAALGLLVGQPGAASPSERGYSSSFAGYESSCNYIPGLEFYLPEGVEPAPSHVA